MERGSKVERERGRYVGKREGEGVRKRWVDEHLDRDRGRGEEGEEERFGKTERGRGRDGGIWRVSGVKWGKEMERE